MRVKRRLELLPRLRIKDARKRQSDKKPGVSWRKQKPGSSLSAKDKKLPVKRRKLRR